MGVKIMNIKKSRLVEIIREEITEARLRKRIRGVIREFTGGSTALGGAEKKGFQSKTRKSAQSTYDTKNTDYKTKSADYDAAVAAKDDSKRYRKNNGTSRRPAYVYSATAAKGYATNPDWTSWNTDILGRGNAKNTASTAKDSAETTLDTRKAADLEKTRPKQKQQTGGGKGGFGKGKAKGKKKKN